MSFYRLSEEVLVPRLGGAFITRTSVLCVYRLTLRQDDLFYLRPVLQDI